MGNAVSPNLNDTEHQLLQDNNGKCLVSSVCFVGKVIYVITANPLCRRPLFADSTPPLNTLLPSPGAWPYSASDSPLNNAHNSGNPTITLVITIIIARENSHL